MTFGVGLYLYILVSAAETTVSSITARLKYRLFISVFQMACNDRGRLT